ncbi:hypothetical protein [Paraburkholderia sp. BL25I1N1]|uniref:hypothetical protein n=1 Tax=Paraburkholderia sp. BL25I1N1 TaxID=1938804 RepID=UPI000D487EF7|nr:hypothetical protein [Paraburkholderia sp. BL25I1N1]PRY04462.1 hypothetical protein B0G73_112138 [Paraburkholderia sp. BL25I1N1]
MRTFSTSKTVSAFAHILCCSGLLAASGAPADAASAGRFDATSQPAVRATSIHRVVGDDPVSVRNALQAEGMDAGPRSLSDRFKDIAAIQLRRVLHDIPSTRPDLTHDFVFVVPVPYGIHYRRSQHELILDVSLSDDGHPDGIVLRKTVTGSSGRGLAIAPEARAKGYVQTFDTIEIKTSGKQKTNVRGRLKVSPAEISTSYGNWAIALVCTLEPPYLSERSEHEDPNDDEPTDITTRVSTFHGDVRAVWLINQKTGHIVSTGLHLDR